MIRVFHGTDGFLLEEALTRIKSTIGVAEVREANTTEFAGRAILPGPVLAAAHAIPFLADRRLVIVRGVLERLDNSDKTLPQGWDNIGDLLADIPATSELVFVESSSLRKNGRGLRAAGPKAEVSEFRPFRGPALEAWITDRFVHLGAHVATDAVSRLTWLCGADLHLLNQEVAKLALFADGRQVTRADVDLMVSEAREENIFATVDAVLERKAGVAMKQVYSLVQQGSTTSDILNMLARQVRMVILARDLMGLPNDEIGRRLGIGSGFVLEKTLRQAQRFSHEYLSSILHRLLQADLSIKTGIHDERLAVELLVAAIAT